ncbi:hypothetical protein EYS10_12660 [Rahnella aquatilis]|nr:hypothetical protein EYS10_12660 [Rahnella aquatilis]
MLTAPGTTIDATTHRPTGMHDAATRLCAAWAWLETHRRSAPGGADVWDIRWQAGKSHTYLADLLHTLQAGQYRLSPLQLHGQGDERRAVWGAQDALVLKWVALSIEGQLPLHPSCEHVKGHGGGKPSIEKLHALLTGGTDTPETTTAAEATASKKTADYAWVCRTDIRGYYRSINKATLLNQVRQHVQDPVHQELISQYIHYTVEDGGTFHTPQTGISRGCPLSPLMGALHLYDMDEHFIQQKNIHYARYMDDVIILAKSRWSLRKHTKRLMQWFSEYDFEAHPDKTQIGRTAKGFDWMGAWLTDEGVTDIAPRAKANHREKVRRLYERLARLPAWLRHRRRQQVHARVLAYRKRWNIWTGGLLACAITAAPCSPAWSVAVMITGLPSVLPASAPPGTNVGPGTVGMQSGLSATSFNGFGMASPDQDKNVRVVGGIAYIIPMSKTCPSIGLTAYKMTFAGSKGSYDVAISNMQVVETLTPGGPLSSQGDNWGVTYNGTWALLDDPATKTFICSAYTPDLMGFYKLAFSAYTTYVNGVRMGSCGVNPCTFYGNTVSTPIPPPPTRPVVCTISPPTGPTDFGDGKGGTGEITASTINSRKNIYIAAITSAPISVTATCTGGTGTPKIHGHVTWAKPRYYSAGFYGGLPADGDASAPAILATKPVAYGDYYNAGNMFDTMPAGLHFGDDFQLAPGVAKKLYPALLRDDAAYVKSGQHTISGTIKVVVD